MYLQKDLKTVNFINNSLFEVKWHVTYWCNYRCPYCIQEFHENWLKEDVVIQRAKNLDTLIRRKNRFLSLQILGGEVCYYDWPKILDNVSTLKVLSLTTNFSNKLDYFKRLYEYCDNRKVVFKLLCSYHETGDEFFEKLLELANWCHEKCYRTPGITFVVDNDFDFTIFDRFPDLVNLSPDFCTKKLKGDNFAQLTDEVNANISRILALPKTWHKPSYTLKIKTGTWHFEIGKEHLICPASRILGNLEYNYIKGRNYYCDAGINSIAISRTGNIYRCDNNDDIIGNIDECKLDDISCSVCSSSMCLLCQPVNMIKTTLCYFDPYVTKLEDSKEGE